MRISDWSSDVCSSDLDQCRQQASTIFEQLASEQYIEIDSVQRIEAGLKTKRLFGQAQKRHSCRCGLAIFVEEPGDESLKGIESPNHVVPDCRDRNGVRVSLAQVPYDINRSEEHTSELQSLMRLSYAVFCLKKNKKKIEEQS